MQNARVHYLRRVYKIGKFLRRVAKIYELSLIFYDLHLVAIPLRRHPYGRADREDCDDTDGDETISVHFVRNEFGRS